MRRPQTPFGNALPRNSVSPYNASVTLSRYHIYETEYPYLHDNCVKRGYVDDSIHWRYSSARNYPGQPGQMEVVTGWA
jgi:hypothetical protein